MSKIDVLIIVHNEHEGLLSVGNSERAYYGMRESVIRLPVNPVIWQTGIPAFILDSFNTFNPSFPKKAVLASHWYYYKSCSNAVQMYIISDTAMAAKLTQTVVLLLQHLLYLFYNNYIISTANAVIIVLQFVSISQPSLYHL